MLLYRSLGLLLTCLCLSACRGDQATGDTSAQNLSYSSHAPATHTNPYGRQKQVLARQGASTHVNGGHGALGAESGPEVSTLPRGVAGTTHLLLKPAGPPHRDNSKDTFRTRVRWTHYAYDDPIVYPGQPGRAHLHLFLGNASVDALTTKDNIRSRCRSAAAGGIANCSAYWIPALLDAQGNVVNPRPMSLIYYKAGYQVQNPQDSVVPPQGLQIVAGDANATPDQPQDRDRFFWNCGGSSYDARTLHIPTDCAPGSTLALEVRFPACWNGRDLTSPDHTSHVSYGHQGRCPSSHPVVLPNITFNIMWDVGPAGTQGWRLASDSYSITPQTPGGYSLHADWIMGWDPQIAKRFLQHCNHAFKDCGVDNLGDGEALDFSFAEQG